MKHRYWHLTAIVALAAAAVACSDDDSPTSDSGPRPDVMDGALPAEDGGLAPDAASGDGLGDGAADAVRADEVEGHWTGDWGDMVLRRVQDEIWGAYTHDEGTVVGTFSNGMLVGWWSEVPSREAPDDAGEVEFVFTRAADGTLALDGRWRYGTEGDWREDWDLTFTTAPIDPALEERFDNPDAFRAHP